MLLVVLPTSQCGLNVAGYDTVGARSDSYGYDWPGAKFCCQGARVWGGGWGK